MWCLSVKKRAKSVKRWQENTVWTEYNENDPTAPEGALNEEGAKIARWFCQFFGQ